MFATCVCTRAPAPPPSAQLANEAIRRYVAGRQRWTPEDLAELARLRAAWLDAQQHEEYAAAAVQSGRVREGLAGLYGYTIGHGASRNVREARARLREQLAD